MSTCATGTGGATVARLTAKLSACGQTHLLDDYHKLSDTEKKKLEAFITETDLHHLNCILDTSLAALEAAKHRPDPSSAAVAANDSSNENDGDGVTPPPAGVIFDVERERRMRKKATCAHPDGPTRYAKLIARGQELIAGGQAAVLLLAGGSGTRLGVSYPKGLFDFAQEAESAADGAQPLLRQSKKSLFQFHCERLRMSEQLAAAAAAAAAFKRPAKAASPSAGKMQLLIMTSEQNDSETRAFFADHAWFGLEQGQVHFFTQTSLPVYDADVHEGDVDAAGKPVHRILMEGRGAVCRAPGGNGGVYQSLARRNGVESASLLDILEQKGVRYVQIFSVDNLLAKVGDPLFFGYTATRGCLVAVKTTPKASPQEHVGVFAKIHGRWGVVEYTELGEYRASLRTPAAVETADQGGHQDGSDQHADAGASLVFNCANIACHCCSLAFLRLAAVKMESEPLYHAAIKKVRLAGGTEEKMAVKLEAFIFDMFRYCGEVDEPARASDKKVGKKTKVVKATDGKKSAKAKNLKKTRAVSSRHSSTRQERTTNPDRFGILQVDRAKEFAPIKNCTAMSAADNPRTAAQLYLRLTTRWACAALLAAAKRIKNSAAVAADGETGDEGRNRRLRCLRQAAACLRNRDGDNDNAAGVSVEISPLLSYAGEGLGPYEDFLLTEVLRAKAAARKDGKRHIVLLDEKVIPQSKMWSPSEGEPTL